MALVMWDATDAANQISPRNFGRSSSALRVEDDPDDLARAVASSWVVDHRLGYHVEAEDGIIHECKHLLFREGDFVDVAVTADIFTRFQGGQKKTEVKFAIQDILRLRTKAELQVWIFALNKRPISLI